MWSVMTFPDSSSKKGACQPPYSNPPSRSSSGAPGPCRTPSNDVNILTTSSPMTSSSMAVTSSGLTTRQPETYRPTEEGGRRLPRLGRLLQDLVAGARRGRDGAQTPRLVVLEGPQQFLTGVYHEGAVGGDPAHGSAAPPRIRVTIAAIVLLWLE